MVPQYIASCHQRTVLNDLIVVERGDTDCFEHSWLIAQPVQETSMIPAAFSGALVNMPLLIVECSGVFFCVICLEVASNTYM